MQPTIETERLTLRPFSISDANKVQELAGNFAVADTTWNVPHPYLDGLAEDWIQWHETQWKEKRWANFAIILDGSNELIWSISLYFVHSYLAEIGYWVGEKYWNQWYATEAWKAIIQFWFEDLGLHKIYSTFIERNPASGKVMQKLGMKEEWYFKEHIQKWDKWENVYQYGILKEEYGYI